MRTAILTALGAALLSTYPAATVPRGRAITITGTSYLGDFGPSERVKIWRGVNADIDVRGQFLDLATGVEVRTASGAQTTDVAAAITTRQGGLNTHITVRVTGSTSAALGVYTVLIHYVTETNGPDRFAVQLYERGVVNGVRILEPAEANGAYLAGKPYTLRITGSRLTGAELNPTTPQFKGLVVLGQHIAGSTATQADYSVRFDSVGLFNVSHLDFFDGDLPRPTSRNVWSYDGTGGLSVRVAVQPVVTGVSDRTPNGNASVTLSGANLVVPGFTPKLQVAPRYGTAGPLIDGTISGNDLRFTVPFNMRPDSIAVLYVPTSSQNALSVIDQVVRVPPIAVQGGPPAAFLLDSFSASGVTRRILITGSRTMRGKFLAPNPLPVGLVTAPTRPSAIPGASLPLTPTLGTTPPPPPPSPTVTFAAVTYPVTSSRYDRNTLLPNGERGADIVTFTVPVLSDTVTRDLVVTTPGGSTTIGNVLYLPEPLMTSLVRSVGNGQTVPVTTPELIRGATYEVGGDAIIIMANGIVLHTATLRLNGVVIPTSLSGTSPRRLVFTVPATATSGPLTAETRAGTHNSGVYTVSNPAAAVTLAGLQLSPVDVVGGQAVTATVAINGAVPAGTGAGTLVVSLSQTDSAVTLPAPVAIRANPTTFQITTHPVSTLHTTTVRVRPDVGTGTQFATLRIHPPAPTGLTFNFPTAAVGGRPVTGTVQLDGTAPPGFTVALASSDPSTGPVPATAAASGTTATFTFTPPVVGSSRAVTITATSDGQTKSATLTVLPPSIASLTVSSSTVVGPGQVPVTFGLTAPATAGQTATIHCFPIGITCPSSVALSGTSGSFTATLDAVPTARDVSVEVSAGTQTSRATIALRPLAVQSATVSPATVAAGTTSSLTLQLNRAAILADALTLQLTSSDSTVASLPAHVTFPPGQQTQLVPITTRAPLAQQKTITITATGTATTPSGPVTLSTTATITVRP
jgi:hypothetical protein